MARVLVVEDKEALRALVARVLGEAHTVAQAAHADAARAALDAESFDLVVCDVRLPDADGFEVLAHVRANAPETEVILMTAYATVEAAVQAVKAGAYDYVAKPFEPEDLVFKAERALERRRLRARARAAEAELRRHQGADGLLGSSPGIRTVRELAGRVADLDVTVLLTGESGTGKEVVARAIHRTGARAERPFVAVNCGAIPESLLESELFGHARGAFTGASSERVGLFEQAADGTLFLDEVGDMPLGLQVKLNRALEARRFRRVGEDRERTLEARVVVATHRDLQARVAEGAFREDLFFRLNVFPISIPPLRARGDDVILLARHFLETAARRFDQPVTDLEPGALERLLAHDWPGNVRELQHAIERAVIVASGSRLRAGDLPPSVQSSGGVPGASFPGLAEMSYRDALDWARDRITHRYLDAVLRRHGGNVTQAARQAGVERESLHRLLRKAGLDAADYRRGR